MGVGRDVRERRGINCFEYGGVIFKIAGFTEDEFSISQNALSSVSVGGSTPRPFLGRLTEAVEECFEVKSISGIPAGATTGWIQSNQHLQAVNYTYKINTYIPSNW